MYETYETYQRIFYKLLSIREILRRESKKETKREKALTHIAPSADIGTALRTSTRKRDLWGTRNSFWEREHRLALWTLALSTLVCVCVRVIVCALECVIHMFLCDSYLFGKFLPCLLRGCWACGREKNTFKRLTPTLSHSLYVSQSPMHYLAGFLRAGSDAVTMWERGKGDERMLRISVDIHKQGLTTNSRIKKIMRTHSHEQTHIRIHSYCTFIVMYPLSHKITSPSQITSKASTSSSKWFLRLAWRELWNV